MYVKCRYSFLIYNVSSAEKFKGDWCERLTTFVKKKIHKHILKTTMIPNGIPGFNCSTDFLKFLTEQT